MFVVTRGQSQKGFPLPEGGIDKARQHLKFGVERVCDRHKDISHCHSKLNDKLAFRGLMSGAGACSRFILRRISSAETLFSLTTPDTGMSLPGPISGPRLISVTLSKAGCRLSASNCSRMARGWVQVACRLELKLSYALSGFITWSVYGICKATRDSNLVKMPLNKVIQLVINNECPKPASNR